MQQVNIMIAGGCGFWCEQNHYPAILDIKRSSLPIRVSAIVDPRNPYTFNLGPAAREIVQQDAPEWINPSSLKSNALIKKLNTYIRDKPCQAIFVATNPIHHAFYAEWGLSNGINVLCDKPPVLEANSAFDLQAALSNWKRFIYLCSLEKLAKNLHPGYLFCTPLRRRALTPFLKISEHLAQIYTTTGVGIRHMNVIVNGGLHRYPSEFLHGGAHGYLEGVGSLSHSSYHYIDLIAWYLKMAPGKITKLRIDLPYLTRVGHYLDGRGYEQIVALTGGQILECNSETQIPKSIRNCELDFTFHIHLFDERDIPLGLISYTSNHSTYTPRQLGYDSNRIDPAYHKLGGRMSQLYIDIHQGALQNWQLIKNDRVFHGNEITTIQRQHPEIGSEYEFTNYPDAYETETITPRDLVQTFLLHSNSSASSAMCKPYLATLNGQSLTYRLFSCFYELIAHNYGKKNHRYNQFSSILLTDFLLD